MKKLSLKKTTLSRLNDNALNNVKGGHDTKGTDLCNVQAYQTIERECQPTNMMCLNPPYTSQCLPKLTDGCAETEVICGW